MKYLLIPLIALLLFSCKSDDPAMDFVDDTTDDTLDDPTILTTSDLVVSISENPEEGQVIGTVEGTTDSGTIFYSIEDQSNPGAMNIDPDTGDLVVLDPLQFDFEQNEEITATIMVSNGSLEQNALITVEILDVFLENDLRLEKARFLNYPYDWVGSIFCDAYNGIYHVDEVFAGFYAANYEVDIVNAKIIHDGTKITEYFHIMAFDYGSQTQRRLTFTYDTNNRISSIHRHVECFGGDHCPPEINEDYSVTYNGNSMEVVNTVTNEMRKIFMNNNGSPNRYEYSDGNVDFVYDDNGNLISKSDQNGNQFTYTYDTKRNPYYGVTSFNWNEVQNIFFTMPRLNWQYEHLKRYNHGIWTNRNNIVEVDIISCSNNDMCIRSNRYLYEYNSDGYPASKTFLGYPEEILLFEYQ